MKRIKYLLPILVLLLSIFAYTSFRDYKPDLAQITAIFRHYPALENPKTVTLNCDYHGKKLSVSETLYGSVDEYYKSEPQKRLAYYANNNKSFVFNYKEDQTIVDLTNKIEKIGEDNSLNSDQTLDLASCFLQSIPYDEAKAQKILSPDFAKYSYAETVPRYPYETLYDFTGICTDKSYLGAAIFKEMGYHTSLLEFDSDKHLSVGIGVPAGYQELGTNYAIMELTGAGFVVGDIPALKTTGFAQNTIDNLPEISSDNPTNSLEQKSLSNANRVVEISTGKEYSRIVERMALKKQIDVTRNQIDQQKAAVEASENSLKKIEGQLQSAESYYKLYPSRQTYSQYSEIYDQYQTAFNNANNQIATYNRLIKKYNSLVNEYRNY